MRKKKKEIKVEKRLKEEELFGDIEKNIDDSIKKRAETKNKFKDKKELDNEFNKFLEEGINKDNLEQGENNEGNNNDNNKVDNNADNIRKETLDSAENLFNILMFKLIKIF